MAHRSTPLRFRPYAGKRSGRGPEKRRRNDRTPVLPERRRSRPRLRPPVCSMPSFSLNKSTGSDFRSMLEIETTIQTTSDEAREKRSRSTSRSSRTTSCSPPERLRPSRPQLTCREWSRKRKAEARTPKSHGERTPNVSRGRLQRLCSDPCLAVQEDAAMLSVAITRFLRTNQARKKWKHALTRDDRSKRRNARFASEQGVFLRATHCPFHLKVCAPYRNRATPSSSVRYPVTADVATALRSIRTRLIKDSVCLGLASCCGGEKPAQIGRRSCKGNEGQDGERSIS